MSHLQPLISRFCVGGVELGEGFTLIVVNGCFGTKVRFLGSFQEKISRSLDIMECVCTYVGFYLKLLLCVVSAAKKVGGCHGDSPTGCEHSG